MEWFIFALVGAVFDAVYYSITKRFLKNIGVYALAGGTFTIAGIILSVFSFIKGVPELGEHLYIGIIGTGILNIIAASLYYKALKITDLSLAVPMTALTPIFLILTSFIILGEVPTLYGAAGIVLIVIGCYILSERKKGMRLLDPFRELYKHQGIRYMLIVAFLFSISASFDKMVIVNSDVFFGPAIVYFTIGIPMLAIAKIKNEKVIRRTNDLWKYIFTGIILFISAISINKALSIELVSYVISIKRSSILFSVLIGGLFFMENNLLKRSIGASIMIAGMALIILF